MPAKEKPRGTSGTHRVNHQQNLKFTPALPATSRELFAYADAVAEAIPRLPDRLKSSSIRHFLAVCGAALNDGPRHGTL